MFPVSGSGIRGSFCGLTHCQKDKEGVTFLEAPGNQEGRTFYRIHGVHVAVCQLKRKAWPVISLTVLYSGGTVSVAMIMKLLSVGIGLSKCWQESETHCSGMRC